MEYKINYYLYLSKINTSKILQYIGMKENKLKYLYKKWSNFIILRYNFKNGKN